MKRDHPLAIVVTAIGAAFLIAAINFGYLGKMPPEEAGKGIEIGGLFFLGGMLFLSWKRPRE